MTSKHFQPSATHPRHTSLSKSHGTWKQATPRRKKLNLDIGTNMTREATNRCTKRVIVALLILILFSGIAMILFRLGELGT